MERCAAARTRRGLLRASLALASLSLLTGCGVHLPLNAGAPKVPRVGVLLAGSATSESGEELRRGLADRGYVDGHNLLLDWRSDQGLPDRMAQQVAALVAQRPDVIVAIGTQRAVMARGATATIPIVLASGTDPVAAGLVESIARPGGNVTGHLESHPQLASRQLQLLREIAPAMSQVTAIGELGQDARYAQLEAAARALGLRLRLLRTPTDAALDEALAREAAEPTDALIALHSGFIALRQTRLFEFAASKRIPAMYGRRSYAEAGGLAAYGPNVRDLFAGAAASVDKILKGAKPAELPVELPSKFDFVLNRKAADAIGLTIPRSVLEQATEVMQ